MANNIAVGTATFTPAAAGSTPTQQPAAAVDSLVWPSQTVSLGPITTGITTRGLHDVLVMSAAIGFAIAGFYLLMRPDIEKLFNTAIGAIKPVAETAAVA